MKRTLSMALVLGLITASAFAAEVTSINTVGYKTVAIAPGYSMLSLNWLEVGGLDEIPINDLFSDTQESANLTPGTDTSSADTIRIYNGSGYDTYIYSTAAGAWASSGTPKAPTTDALPLGVGFWFFKQGGVATELTFTGEANESATPHVHPMPAGYVQFGSAFAAASELNGINWDWTGATAGTDTSSADTIRVWNGAGYDTYIYSAAAGAWANSGTPKAPTADSIPLGTGAWYYRQPTSGGTTFNESKPY